MAGLMLFADTVEVLTYPVVKDRGREAVDYKATPTAVPIVGVDVQPGASTELVAQRRDASAVRWSVFIPVAQMPAGMKLTSDSIIRFRAQRYEVDGDPLEWINGSPLDYYLVALIAWKRTT